MPFKPLKSTAMFKGNDLSNQFNAFTNGSPSAFAYFFGHYNPRIYYYLLQMVRNGAIARELTEKAFLALFANHTRISSVDHLLAFLYHFARKCGGKYLEGLPCTEEDQNLPAPPAAEILDILQDVAVIRNESQTGIQSAIQELSQQRKKVVEMRFFLQLDVRTIAAELNISPQTVRNHLSQSMFCLRKWLGRGFDPGSLFI